MMDKQDAYEEKFDRCLLKVLRMREETHLFLRILIQVLVGVIISIGVANAEIEQFFVDIKIPFDYNILSRQIPGAKCVIMYLANRI